MEVCGLSIRANHDKSIGIGLGGGGGGGGGGMTYTLLWCSAPE